MEPLLPNFYTTSQAAALLGVSRITIFRWIKDGSLPSSKISNLYLIPRQEIESRIATTSHLSTKGKEEIRTLMIKAIRDYGETIRMLGRE